jgi:hypothetical protein
MDKAWPQHLIDTAISVLFDSAHLAVVKNVSMFLILSYCFRPLSGQVIYCLRHLVKCC